MKPKNFIVAFLFVLFLVVNVEAQVKVETKTSEEIWREYKMFSRSYIDMLSYYNLDEPYYSLALIELANDSNYPISSLVFMDMINRLPNNSDYLFREFWHRFRSVANQYQLRDILTNEKIEKLPKNLNWFVDDAAETLLRKEMSVYVAWSVGCNGPRKYRKNFLERFFSQNNDVFELTLAFKYCDENKEPFLEEILRHPNLNKASLLEILVNIEYFPKFYDYYFSLLLIHKEELTRFDLDFIEASCKVEQYCFIFLPLKFSSVLKRKEELLEIMKK